LNSNRHLSSSSRTAKIFALGSRFGLVVLLLTMLFGAPALLRAQDAAGMTGTVTDASGAVVPGATVTLVNKSKGLKFTLVTNSSGDYRFSNIPPGPGYEAIFTSTGFAPFDVKDIYLTVGTVRTQNAKVAAKSDVAINVSAANAEVTINTTDATIGNNLDVSMLNDLPVQQRSDPTALFKLQPGVAGTSVTGARTDQNHVTLDGLDVDDLATGGASQTNSGISQGFSIVAGAPIDSVQEFRGTVGGLPAAATVASGGQFALLTKGGSNQYHGNINEYHRDPSLVANCWYCKNSTPITPRNHLIQNQFGGNIGGPVRIPHLFNGRDKLFFFFDYDNSRIISSALTQRTVPLDHFRCADSAPSASACTTPTLGYINTGGTTSYLTLSQVQGLDPSGLGADLNWLYATSKRFPHSNNSSSGDGVNSGGYSFNAPFNNFLTNYVSRLDYNINTNQKVFVRFSIARQTAVENANEFANDPVSNPFIDRSYAFVIGHDWTIGSAMTNQVIIGEVVEKYNYPNAFNPTGSTFFTFADGTGPALASSLYLNPNAQARRIPIPMIGDDFTYTKGKHTFQIGGTFKDIKAHYTNVADFNAVELGMGGNTLSLCGGGGATCGSNPSLRPATIATTGTLGNLAEYDYDQAFTYALARIGEVSSDFNYNAAGAALPQLTGDQRFYKFYQTELYFSDTWKALPSLSITYGVTYQYFTVPYETRGLQSEEPFTFSNYLQARVTQSSLGQTGPTAVPLIPYYLGGKANGGPPLISPEYRNFAPHLGFNYNPSFDKKMVIRGGAGFVYDRTIINAVQQIQDADSYLFQQSAPFPQGVTGDPYGSLKTRAGTTDPGIQGPDGSARLNTTNNIPAGVFSAPATPAAPYEPFVAGGVPYGLQIGSAFNATIDPALKTPYSIQYNAGIERQIPWDMVLKVNYVGRLGRRLLAQPDANQVLDFPDPVSGQLLSQAFASVSEQLRAGATSATVIPQPFFENVMGAGYTKGVLVPYFGPFVYRGDFGDTVQFMSDTGAPLNVGSAAQFSENTFYTNSGFSSYNGLLLTLQKNLSHGLQFDFNYTYAHSIDNVSFFANSEGDTGIGGVGLICDVIRARECRSNSDFNIKQYITADATYDLPVGRGKMFFGDAPRVLDEAIGGWALSTVTTWHSGQTWGNDANAFDASYSNDAPGILVGPKSNVATHVNKLAGGGVNIFANQAAAAASYVGPIGFQVGARNSLVGPRYFDVDLGLAKTFPIYNELNLKFRADAFNAFNHPSFGLPQDNVFNGYDQQDFTSSTFGQISNTEEGDGNNNNGARVLQLSLRLEF